MPVNQMLDSLFSFAKRDAKTRETAIGETIKPEAQLVERILAGEIEAFNELYKMFAPMIHGIILARLPRDEVDDIVQEVFISAYKNLKTLRDKNAVGGWLAMIARNKTNEFYRSAKPTEELTEEFKQKDDSETQAREILYVILSLPETYRETLVLRLVEGMTGNEISEKTGLTPESVRVNLHRGMKILRQKLGIEE